MPAKRAHSVFPKRSSRSRISKACFQVQALESRVLLSVALNNSFWTPIGPAPLNNGSSGRVTALAADPSNPNILYAGAAGGGIWKTIDGGTSWAPLTDSQTTLSTGALAVAPNNPNVIYAGTGEADNSPLAYYGRGILVSTNGGTSWTLTGNANFNQKTISQIAVDPSNPQVAYAAVTAVGQNTTAGGTGIWKTTNGGTSWSNTTTAVSSTAPFTDIKVDPSNPQHLLAAIGGAVAQSGVYVSTNGGTSWALQGGGLPSGTTYGWTRVAFAPSNPQVIYATFTTNSNGNLASAWTTTNGGANWTQLTATPNFLLGQGNYASTLIVDPKNPAIVYAGGGSGTNSFVETTNSGASWTDISTAVSGTSPHNMHHAIAVDAVGRVVDGNDGGVWRLDNPVPGQQGWSDITSNLQIGQMLGGAIDPANPTSNILAGNQGNAVNQFTGTLTWTARDSSDSGAVRINQTTAGTVYRQVPSTSAFGTSGIFRRSTDGGVTWANATTGITTTDPQATYAPFVVDPTNGNRVLFATNRVYETTNSAGNWTAISTTNLNGWNTTAAIVALAVAPSAPTTIYASAGGSVWFTTNDGAAWTQRTTPATFTTLLVDPSNSLVCYGLTTAFGTQHVYKTTDGGATWNTVAGNLPDLPTYSIALNTAANTIYVGNDNGVYATTNGGSTWAPYANALPNVQVRDLQYNATTNTLAAFTLGRGVFEISTSIPNTVVVNATIDDTTPGNGLTSLREAVQQLAATGGNITFDPTLAGLTLTLNAANGNISIPNNINITGPANRPTLSAGGGAALEIAGGASVNLSNFILSGSGTVLQVDSTAQPQLQNVTVTGNVLDNGSLTVNQLANDTLTGSITGAGSLTKTGPGTLTLNGANSYAGGTTVQSGTLQGNTNALVGIWTVNAPGIIAIDETALPSSTGTFSGAITGTGTVRVTGTATTLNLANTATISNSGAIVVDAGDTLVPTAANNLNSTAILYLDGTLNLNGFNQTIGGLTGPSPALVYNVSTQANLTATLTIGGDNRFSFFAGLLENVPVGSANGGVLALQKTGSGTLTLAPANTFTGGLTLGGGTLNMNNGAAIGTGRLTISGGTLDNTSLSPLTLTNNNPQTWSGSFTFNGAAALNTGTGAVTLTTTPTVTVNLNSLTVPGAISGGFGLGKSGAGNLILSGANNYSGGTTINAGTLTGNTASLQGGFADGSVLVFDQTLNAVTDGTFNGSVNGAGAINFANGTVRLATNSLLRNFGLTTVTGKLVAPASGGLNALSNISSYDVEGTLDLGASSQTVASLFGAGTVYHFAPNGQPALATLTLGGDDSSTVFTGNILDTQPASGNAGTLAVDKIGQGIFTVTGANTFSGGTTVAAGILGVGPSPTSSDPLGSGPLVLNGGDLVLNGRTAPTTQQIVPATGYNQDLIVDAATTPANASLATTGTVDSTYVWYEKNYNSQTTTGLPVGAAAFTSASNPAVTFQLQPYNANNVAFINGGAGSVTLTLNTPAAFSTINVLAAAANGNAGLVAQLNFADGSAVFTQFNVLDWFNTTNSNTAYTSGGRAARSTGAVTLVPGQARLFEYDFTLPVTSQNKLLTSINFIEASGNQVGVYALSGAAMTVPAAQSYPNAVQILAAANIDVEGSLTASLGNLTIAGTQLTLTGPASSSLAFGPTTLTGNATFNTDTGISMSLGAVGETSGPRNLTKTGPGTLTLTAADSYTGTTTASAGNLVANVAGALPTNRPVSITATGTVTLAQSSPSFTTTTGLISIANGGVLNISNNTLFINYGSAANDPITQIGQFLANGYNSGTWTGAASASSGTIRSSTAAATPGTAIGFADSADGTGVNTTPNSVELKYTLGGDTTLNGAVDIFDLNALLAHYNKTGGWTGGDSTYNGNVDIFDLNALLANYNHSLPAVTPALTSQTTAVSLMQPTAAPTTTAAVSASTLFAPANTSTTDPTPRRNSRRNRKRF